MIVDKDGTVTYADHETKPGTIEVSLSSAQHMTTGPKAPHYTGIRCSNGALQALSEIHPLPTIADEFQGYMFIGAVDSLNAV
jgi:hypothetical protein